MRVLTANRRAGAAVLTSVRHLASRMPLPRLPAEAARRHRAPGTVRDGGRVDVRTYPSPGAELDGIADVLRRAHLEDGVPWRDMAVLARATAALPALRRALASSGVPVDLDTSDIPLHAEPAVAPLLLALRLAAQSALPALPAPGGRPRERAGGPRPLAAGSGRRTWSRPRRAPRPRRPRPAGTSPSPPGCFPATLPASR